MVVRSTVVVLLALTLLGGLQGGQADPGQAQAGPKVTATPCLGFQMVPGQGPSCPIPGGWVVRLADGTWVETHGPDAPPGEDPLPAPDPVSGPEGTPPGPQCVTNPAEPHALLVYTVPAGKTDRYDAMAPKIRQMATTANNVVRAEAWHSAQRIVDLKVLCDLTGTLVVAHEILATPAGLDNFATITSELRARGYTSPQAKYWVWHDDRVRGYGGQGTLASDSYPSLINDNNVGPAYAITYGYNSWWIMLHELGHNLGAVQRDAPNTSGAGHCNDGRDVMCYSDGGSKSAYRHNVCSAAHFDCGHDDYFHPKPGPDNYLFDHWNVASPLNRFVALHGGCGPREGVLVNGEATITEPTPATRWVEDLEPDCSDRYYQLLFARWGPANGDLDVCWYAGTTVLECHATPGEAEKGTVPTGATRAEVTYHGPGATPFFLWFN